MGLLSADGEGNGFVVHPAESFGIVEDEGKVATAAGTWHLPGQHAVHLAVAVYVVLYAWLYHGGEHADLCFE